MKYNLLSVKQFENVGAEVIFKNHICKVVKNGIVIIETEYNKYNYSDSINWPDVFHFVIFY